MGPDASEIRVVLLAMGLDPGEVRGRELRIGKREEGHVLSSLAWPWPRLICFYQANQCCFQSKVQAGLANLLSDQVHRQHQVEGELGHELGGAGDIPVWPPIFASARAQTPRQAASAARQPRMRG